MLSACVEGIGVLGPGLTGWPVTRAVLTGEVDFVAEEPKIPSPEVLPAAERRRVGRVVKLALAVGSEAASHAGVSPKGLASVFTSSGGDGSNCHEICEALSMEERQISPTRFHNSVHNAAAGYWSIATGATAASNALCAFDASFAAGLLEAVTQVVVEKIPVLLVAYDAQYPAPLFGKRPIPEAFGVALVLVPRGGPRTICELSLSLCDDSPDRLADAALETLRESIPAARALPLLRQIARGRPDVARLEYMAPRSLAVAVASRDAVASS